MTINNNRSLFIMIAGSLIAVVAFGSVILNRSSQAQQPDVLEFDIAEDMPRFVFDDGLPADGSSFITRGYLYPVGTLSNSSGVNPDGSPEFPELVLGEWICQGYMINDAAHTSEGVWVFSTQFFHLSAEPGGETISSIAALGTVAPEPEIFPVEIHGKPFVLMGGLYAGSRFSCDSGSGSSDSSD